MTRVVVDASITGVVLLSDEITESSAPMLDRLLGSKLLLAAHWPLEVASLLVKATRRQRMQAHDRAKRLVDIDRLVDAGEVQSAASTRTIFDLAMATGLTAYDAVYLELALRLDATLATNDDALIAAARARGVPVLTTRS